MLLKEDFISYLRFEKRYSEHTILAYENDLKQYERYCSEQLSEEMTLDPRAIRLWMVHLLETHHSNRSVHRKLSTIGSYAKYLIRKGELRSNPLEKIIKPRLNKRLPVFIDEDPINKLLNTHDFGQDFSGLRNRLIIELLYQTGMRRAELINLHISSIDLESGTLKVLGKRNKERIIPVRDQLKELIIQYINTRNSTFPESDIGNLLLTDRGNAAYPKLIYRVVTEYMSMITTLEKKSPHVLRHSFATHLLNKGADLNAIKELLGHANLAATQVYTHNSFEKLKSIYHKAHPRAD